MSTNMDSIIDGSMDYIINSCIYSECVTLLFDIV